MEHFKEILLETGVPQPDFMVVPQKGENLVCLAGARGGKVRYSHEGKVSVRPVKEHDVSHYLRKERGLFGHHDRPNVLLSNGIQSLRLDKQLVVDMNPP